MGRNRDTAVRARSQRRAAEKRGPVADRTGPVPVGKRGGAAIPGATFEGDDGKAGPTAGAGSGGGTSCDQATVADTQTARESKKEMRCSWGAIKPNPSPRR